MDFRKRIAEKIRVFLANKNGMSQHQRELETDKLFSEIADILNKAENDEEEEITDEEFIRYYM